MLCHFATVFSFTFIAFILQPSHKSSYTCCQIFSLYTSDLYVAICRPLAPLLLCQSPCLPELHSLRTQVACRGGVSRWRRERGLFHVWARCVCETDYGHRMGQRVIGLGLLPIPRERFRERQACIRSAVGKCASLLNNDPESQGGEEKKLPRPFHLDMLTPARPIPKASCPGSGRGTIEI